MKIDIVKDYEELSRKAAEKVIETANLSDAFVNICIPTGLTPLGLYKKLAEYSKNNPQALQNVNWFTLDEYINIPNGSPQSCFSKLRDKLYQPAGISLDQVYTFNTEAEDFKAEAARYESLIESMGGLDLTILGIGRNGHVGFNEPGSTLDSKTRVINLQKETIEQSKNYFEEGETLPTAGITLGIHTLIASKKILLIANGSEKKKIVQSVVEGEVSPDIPASFFRTVQHAQFLFDEKASHKLTIKG